MEVAARNRELQQRAQTRRAQQPRIDYSRFSHRTAEHQANCDSCHKFPTKNWQEVRREEDAFPDVTDFPDHPACLECHRSQFFARERPAPVICSNCHIHVTPRNSERYPFPSLGKPFWSSPRAENFSSQFAVYFPHETHLDVVGLNLRRPSAKDTFFARISFTPRESSRQESDPKSCSVCHQTHLPQGESDDEFVTPPPKDLADEAFWLKKGAFKTTPDTHAGCFMCHSADMGISPAPGECDACHRLKAPLANEMSDFASELALAMGITDRIILNAWRRRGAGRFRHEFSSHAELSCITCHNVTTMNTALPESVKVPVSSCGGAEGCHVTASADDGGILNYEIDERGAKPNFECVKCHIDLGKQPIPKSHIDAIAKAAGA